MLRVFIGYDSTESVAYHVLAHSILRRASIPVTIAPLRRELLAGIYTRPRDPSESTEFSLTRFLVPYLCNYEGTALYLDCDILCQMDVAQFKALSDADLKTVLWCAQHEYTPKASHKFHNHVNPPYPRKNWSSVMYFNNIHCQALTPRFVNEAPPALLHRFAWLRSKQRLGSLPLSWNWLVGEYDPKPDAEMLHFTLGGVWHRDFRVTDAEETRWHDEYTHMIGAAHGNP